MRAERAESQLAAVKLARPPPGAGTGGGGAGGRHHRVGRPIPAWSGWSATSAGHRSGGGGGGGGSGPMRRPASTGEAGDVTTAAGAPCFRRSDGDGGSGSAAAAQRLARQLEETRMENARLWHQFARADRFRRHWRETNYKDGVVRARK
jgi:hypothetical protein|eukprot:COSAG01_NODE_5647_length_4118_cov_6.676288_4_plen_149_part_00